MRGYRWTILSMVVGLCAALLVPLRGLSAVPDAVNDAKRKAAAQLFKDGKSADALTLLTEVTKADDTSYADHLMLAHIQEKLGSTPDALREYRRVIELLPGSPSKPDERAARNEADRRVKMMDPMAGKVDSVVEDFQRKLDALEKDAIAARDMVALERIFRLRGKSWEADHLKDRGVIEIQANQGWQSIPIEIKAGTRYHFRAAGTWRVHAKQGSNATVLVTAAGISGAAPMGDWSALPGQLICSNGIKSYAIGENQLIVLPTGGSLSFLCNDYTMTPRTDLSGSVQLLIYPE